MTATLKDKVRDLDADLAICEAATPGPIRITQCGCQYESCNQVFISLTHSDGRLDPDDARFIVEAREGWQQAIVRAQYAEAQLDRLQDELRMVQDELNRLQRRGRCID